MTLTCDSNFSAFDITPNQSYTFTVADDKNKNCSLYFYSELDNYFFSDNESLIFVKNGTKISNGNQISNIYLNNTENVHITISKEKIEEKTNNSTKSYFRGRKINKKKSLTGILLVSILVPIIALGALLGMIIMTKKATPKVVANPTEDSLNRFNN